MFPLIAHAQNTPYTADTVLTNIFTQIINPGIILLFIVAFGYFVWGVFEYLKDGNTDPKARTTGRDHMIWGLVGLAIMVGVYAIIGFIVNTLDLDKKTDSAFKGTSAENITKPDLQKIGEK